MCQGEGTGEGTEGTGDAPSNKACAPARTHTWEGREASPELRRHRPTAETQSVSRPGFRNMLTMLTTLRLYVSSEPSPSPLQSPDPPPRPLYETSLLGLQASTPKSGSECPSCRVTGRNCGPGTLAGTSQNAAPLPAAAWPAGTVLFSKDGTRGGNCRAFHPSTQDSPHSQQGSGLGHVLSPCPSVP